MARERRLTHIKDGRRRLFRESDIQTYINDRVLRALDVSKALKDLKGYVREARCLQSHELKGIRMHAPADLILMMEISASLGLREGEVAGLSWRAIDFERRTVQIGGISNFKTKSRESRMGFLPESLASKLKNRQLNQPLGTEWVFPSKFGSGPIRTDVIRKMWARTRERAQLTDVVFHDLRATAAVGFAEHGAGDTVIAKVLGHGPAMARKYSSTVRDNVKRNAVNAAHSSVLSMLEAPEFLKESQVWQDSGRMLTGPSELA
jgi:integrase